MFGNGDVNSIADAARMIADTGCHGIAVGRGALANPWFFRQLAQWVETGDPGPRATYHDRIDFMARHLDRLVEWKQSEKAGCANFRKVAAWYGKALRMTKAEKHNLTHARVGGRVRRGRRPPPGRRPAARLGRVGRHRRRRGRAGRAERPLVKCNC